MKKFVLAMIASLLCSYYAQAATTALAESLLEFEAITNYIGGPSFTVIGPDEFVVEIERLTRRVNVLGVVEYRVCTRRVGASMEDMALDTGHEGRPYPHYDYIATLTVSPNPGIGPNIITVNSVVPCATTLE